METKTDNLKIWNQLKTPPSSAMKKITGGRMSGKTDINPQWRYQIMTDCFGICGNGWGFEIKKLWTDPAPDGQVFAMAEIALWWFDESQVRHIVPGLGGSMLIVKESTGLHCNDDAFKMSVTDALGTAMKMIGVAADVYLGNFDDSKNQKKKSESENLSKEQQDEVDKVMSKVLICENIAILQDIWNEYLCYQNKEWFRKVVGDQKKKLEKTGGKK